MERARNDVIDAFRGLAILSVMVFHYLYRWAPPMHDSNLYGDHWSHAAWLREGQYGVHLFFVISGLVITMTVLRSRSVWDFAVRRFSRLWPPLAVGGALTLAVTAFGPPEFHRSLADYLASITFFPVELKRQAVDGAYWSLTIEVKFYVVVGLAFALLKDRFWWGVIPVAAFCVLLGNAGHGGHFLISEYWGYFLFGMGCWYGLFEGRWKPAVWLSGAGLLMFAVDNPGFAPSVFIGSGVTAMLILIRTNARIPLLPELGRRSYSFYLIHQFIGVTLIGVFNSVGAPDWLSIAASIAVVLSLSFVLYEVAEQRGRKFVASALAAGPFRRAAAAAQAA